MHKILVITDNIRTQINGVVTTFKNLEVYANNDGYDIVYLDPREFPHIDCPGYPEVKLSWPRRIGEKIRKINPDYIHIATEGPIGLAARCYLDLFNYQYNTSYHTKFPEFLKKIYGIPERLTWWYLRWFHKHSGKVLVNTQTMAQELRDHGFKGEILPWTRGVDRSQFRSSLRVSYKHGPIRLLSVGRVSKEKGLDDFCSLQIPNTIKTVVGDGPYLPDLKVKYPDVEFVGAKSGTDLAWYYANSDVFVFPSKADTFGLVMIEAMAVGTPVAAYPVSGPVDVVIDGVNGCLDNDLVLAVLSASNIERQVVEESSKTWSWQKCWNIFQNQLIKV